MSGWIRVNSDPVTGPLDTSAQKGKKEHVSPSVSWKGWRLLLLQKTLGKLLKCRFDALYQSLYRGTQDYAFVIRLP